MKIHVCAVIPQFSANTCIYSTQYNEAGIISEKSEDDSRGNSFSTLFKNGDDSLMCIFMLPCS